VRDRLILHAITDAYRNILPPNMFPVALIFLGLPPAEVDVNVHPSKIEVRFRHAGFIHDLVRDSIRQALLATRPVATFPAHKTPRPGTVDANGAEFADRLGEEPPLMRGATLPHPERSAPPRQDFRLSAPRPEPRSGRLPLEAALSAYTPTEPAGAEPESAIAAPASVGTSELPLDLRALGQVQESFIVATNPQGLWIVDQHAAHERILFDRHLRLRQEKSVEGQRLLMPTIVELKPEQQVTFREIGEELAANGFEVEPFGQRTVAVKTAPAGIRVDDVERLMLEILEDAGAEGRAVSLEVLRNKIAASISCHAAIKVNTPLDPSKMSWLLHALGKTECPMTCPHGRPIVLRYGLKDLYKAFKRI